jgi:hypothetical protein
MLAKLRPRSAYDVMAALALFVALSTGGAYAADTVFSTDIVDGEVKTADLGSAAVTGAKVAGNAVGTGKVVNDSLTGDDITESTLSQVDAGRLGGVARIGYARRCNEPGLVGAIEGYAKVSGLTSPTYNYITSSDHCLLDSSGYSGLLVQGLRVSAGVYRLCFDLMPLRSEAAAVVTPISGAGGSGVSVDNILSVRATSDADCEGRVFEVRSVDEGAGSGVNYQDANFYLAVVNN